METAKGETGFQEAYRALDDIEALILDTTPLPGGTSTGKRIVYLQRHKRTILCYGGKNERIYPAGRYFSGGDFA